MPPESMVPLSYPLAQGPVDIGISCRLLFSPMFARVFYRYENRILELWRKAIGRATDHSTGRVCGVSPFCAATHPLDECCRGMAWVGCRCSHVCGVRGVEGGLVVRPLSLPPLGVLVLCGWRPSLLLLAGA